MHIDTRIDYHNGFDSLLQALGFKDTEDFKRYMKSKAKPGEYGGMNYNEKRKGYELNYSDNCKHPYGIGGIIKGSFREFRI